MFFFQSQRDSSDDEDEVVKELVKAQNELKVVVSLCVSSIQGWGNSNSN